MLAISEKAQQRLMYLTCPACEKTMSFTPEGCPLVCHGCNEILPDALSIISETSERKLYHLEDFYS